MTTVAAVDNSPGYLDLALFLGPRALAHARFAPADGGKRCRLWC